MLLLALAACAPAQPSRLGPDLASRKVCGWDEPSAGAARVEVGRDGEATTPLLGARVIELAAHDDAPFGAVKRALAPLESTLVRAKVVVGERWLIPMTHHEPHAVPKPKPEEATVRIVGYRRITRRRGAPADRFADVRLDDSRVELFVENEAPAGMKTSVAQLEATLRRIEPPVGVFALSATDETAWRQVVAALVAAACYDRQPGDEPHEVIFE